MRYIESINQALSDLLADERVYLLGEDITDPYGGAFKATKGLSTAYPDRVISTPISEAAIVGMATGMAMRGLRPIVEIMFGDFITLCADQIINGAAKFKYMYNDQVSVPLVIRTPMGGGRGYGPTHSQTIESMFFNVPGIKIIAPSLYHDPGMLLRLAVGDPSPTIFIENKTLYPKKLVTEGGNLLFYDGRLSYSRSPADVTIITYGGITSTCVDVALDLLLNDEINVEIIAPFLIKPICFDDMPTSQRVVTVEETNTHCGWGSEVIADLYERGFTGKAKRVGAAPSPIPASIKSEKEVLPQDYIIKKAILELIND